MGDYKQGSSVRWFFRHRGMLTGGKKYLRSSSVSFFFFFFVAFATYLGDGELGLATGWPISIFFKNKISFSFSFSPWGEVVPQLSSVAIIWVPVTSEIVQ